MNLKTVPISSKNISSVAKMHQKAFQGHLNVLLGYNYIKSFLTWFYIRAETIHYVVENKEGLILGYVIGANWGYQKEMNEYLLKPGIFAILKHPWVIFNKQILSTIYLRFLTLLGRNRHIQEMSVKYSLPMISLVGIAVSEEAKGQNIGKILLDNFEVDAKNRGFKTMRLSVYRSNKRAKAFYEKHGWKEEVFNSYSSVTAYHKTVV